jgi:integration host factor subunit beta
MTRSELIDSLLENHPHLVRKDAEEAVEVILSVIMRAVAEGKRVEIRNFGVFSASLRKAHLARNPKTGKPVQKASARFPKFKAGKPLQALGPIALKQTALSPVALDAASAAPIATPF